MRLPRLKPGVIGVAAAAAAALLGVVLRKNKRQKGPIDPRA